MTLKKHTKTSSAVKKIAYGYLMLHLDFRLGALDLLPGWIGYLLFWSALPILAKTIPSFQLLTPLALVMSVWELLKWIPTIFGESWDPGSWAVVFTVLDLYFHFQLLTDLATLAASYSCPEQRWILQLRTVRTTLHTVLPVSWVWINKQSAVVSQIVTTLITIFYLAIAFWICTVLFSLRRSLESQDDPGAL